MNRNRRFSWDDFRFDQTIVRRIEIRFWFETVRLVTIVMRTERSRRWRINVRRWFVDHRRIFQRSEFQRQNKFSFRKIKLKVFSLLFVLLIFSFRSEKKIRKFKTIFQTFFVSIRFWKIKRKFCEFNGIFFRFSNRFHFVASPFDRKIYRQPDGKIRSRRDFEVLLAVFVRRSMFFLRSNVKHFRTTMNDSMLTEYCYLSQERHAMGFLFKRRKTKVDLECFPFPSIELV